MINLLFFDYIKEYPKGNPYSEYIHNIVDCLQKHPEINYQSIEPVSEYFFDTLDKIEPLLLEKDLVLTHPGVLGQDVVLKIWPQLFPKLKIGVLTFNLLKYQKEPKYKNTEILDISNIESIIQFVLSAKK